MWPLGKRKLEELQRRVAEEGPDRPRVILAQIQNSGLSRNSPLLVFYSTENLDNVMILLL